MANYTIADVKALRAKTGAGMSAVKKALEESDGDYDKALEFIRVQGLAGVANREGRAASDGLVAATVLDTATGKEGVMVEVNAETDFVVKNERFITLTEKVLQAAVDSGATTAQELLAAPCEDGTVADAVNSAAAVIGEKLVVRRVARVSGPAVGLYLHRVSQDLPPQIGVMVATDAAGAEEARNVAMHVAVYSPRFLSRDEVSSETIATERRLAEEIARQEEKPEKAIPHIIEGRLTGFFKENVLLDQPYARDSKISVGKLLAEHGAKVLSFVRFKVGV